MIGHFIDFHTIKALYMRYTTLYVRASFRLMDLFFWPIMDLFVWAFISAYMLKVSHSDKFFLFFIGAIIFWDILNRAQQAVSVTFLEEVWSGSFINVLVAPVRVSEFIIATYLVGFTQAFIIFVAMTSLAYYFYAFNLLGAGLLLLPLLINLLILGWTIGLIATGLIIRFGERAQVLAWAISAIIQPLCAVFYPVSILPHWLQPLALAIPATHVFEGLRELLQSKTCAFEHIFYATGLNVLYMLVCAIIFRILWAQSRRLGLLAKLGT